jgi:hypothetical protein
MADCIWNFAKPFIQFPSFKIVRNTVPIYFGFYNIVVIIYTIKNRDYLGYNLKRFLI